MSAARRWGGGRACGGAKTTTFSDGQGRALLSGVIRPGRMHDQTAVRTEGIAEQLWQHPTVRVKDDEGYRGLANEFPDQIDAPPKKPKDDAPLGEHHAWSEQRRRRSSDRIHVEHANAELKQWRPLQRHTGRRDTYPRDPPRHRRTGLRPGRPTQAEHRTGARPADSPLITHQPNRQASTP